MSGEGSASRPSETSGPRAHEPEKAEDRPALPREIEAGFRMRLVGLLGALLVRCWGATLRIERLDEENLRAIADLGGRVCYACWHGSLLALVYSHRGRGVVTLVSRHRDGEIISQIICRMGFGVVRGSTTRGGLKGLLRMARVGRGGLPLGVTPDGPRGPRRTLQPGVLLMAQRSGLPIVPLALEAVRRRELSSWDRFMIPHPWTRVVVVTGAPLHVPTGVDAETLDREWRPRVSAAMDAVQGEADSWRRARVGSR